MTTAHLSAGNSSSSAGAAEKRGERVGEVVNELDQELVLGHCVKLRGDVGDGVDGSSRVRGLEHGNRVEASETCPAVPDVSITGVGVDEDSVGVKQQCAGSRVGHDAIFSQSCCASETRPSRSLPNRRHLRRVVQWSGMGVAAGSASRLG